MAELTANDGRHRYLDGVRGLASIQVLINHSLLAFLPGAARAAGLVADGDFAVLLFFVMSGFVLTESFERQRAGVVRVVVSRFFRLALPVSAACLFGYLLLLAMPETHLRASELAASGFLAGKSVASPLRAAADILCVTMWTGTSNTTLFAALAHHLPSTESSLDPPIWSMHLELWGSLLVLCLVLASRAKPIVLGVALLLAAMLTGITAMALFVCGFLLSHVARAPLVARMVNAPVTWLAGAVLIVAGVLVTGSSTLAHDAAIIGPAPHYAILKPYEWYHAHKAAAALLVFLGLLALPPLQRALSARLVAWLGRMSYAIYLLHMPVLLTLGSLTFVAAHGAGQATAVTLATAVVGVVTLLLAAMFETWVDRPAVNFSRRLRAGVTRSAMS